MFFRILPNSIFRAKSERRKSFISNQLDSCKDCSSLFYLLPFQKGYLLNWDVQRQIWDYLFSKEVLNVSATIIVPGIRVLLVISGLRYLPVFHLDL